MPKGAIHYKSIAVFNCNAFLLRDVCLTFCNVDNMPFSTSQFGQKIKINDSRLSVFIAK